MNNVFYDGRNHAREQMIKRLKEKGSDDLRWEDIKRRNAKAVAEIANVKEDGASPDRSASIKINEGSDSEKTISIITIGHEGYFPTQAELDNYRDALESLGVRDCLLTVYPIDIKQMVLPPIKEKVLAKEKEDSSGDLASCHHGYVDPKALAANVIKNEHILNYCRDMCSKTLTELEDAWDYYRGESSFYKRLNQMKRNVKEINTKILEVLETTEPKSNSSPAYFDRLGESPQADMELVKDITSAINFHSIENESNTPDFILGRFAADSLAAVNKVIKHREQWYDGERQADIAGALFDFAASLTTLETPMTVGSNYSPNTVLDHLTAWSKERGISLEGANVERWNKTGGMPEEQNPSKAEIVSKMIDVARESFGHYISKPAGIPGIRVKEIEKDDGVKSETITKIKNEVIEIMRESLKNLVDSPTGTKADEDIHVSVDFRPSVPLEYIDVTVNLEEGVNIF